MRSRSNILLVVFGLCAVASAAQADDRRFQTSDVVDVATFSSYEGAAWLIRSEDEIEGRIMSKVPTAGDAYTVWIVVFNNPSACEGTPCGADNDFFNPEVGDSVFYGSAAISTPDGGLKTNGKPAGGGVINVDFEIEAGELPDGLFALIPGGLAEGNGHDAEVHLVVDQHPPIPAGMSWISDLTSTNFPGLGPAVNTTAAVFLACGAAPCPGSIFSNGD